MPASNGLAVKFGSRGRTYTQKDFRKMPDEMLLGKVLVFVAVLPWKNEKDQRDVFTMLGIAGKCIREREKAEPQEEGGQP